MRREPARDLVADLRRLDGWHVKRPAVAFRGRPAELVLPSEMAEIDRMAIVAGPFDGPALMRRAGAAVADVVLSHYPDRSPVQVLCGPGKNGGDGYVVAGILHRLGIAVTVHAEGAPRPGSDAATAAGECGLWPLSLEAFVPELGGVVVDALYGAGLMRPLGSIAARAAEATRSAGVPVVAVDLPSGIAGDSGQAEGAAFSADVTVTFVRRKPGHVLLPGRPACGEVILADIGIPDAVVASVGATCFENGPPLWLAQFPQPAVDAHKYSRGHVAVVSGGHSSSGAARLSAMAAATAGAGAVTVLSPASALSVNASHLTSIMLRRADTRDDLLAVLADRPVAALVYGPGLSPDVETARLIFELLAAMRAPPAVVIDASALTAIGKEPSLLSPPPGGRPSALVLTPHEGEFARAFPDLHKKGIPSKLERARRAAAAAEAVVICKGPDTVIAAPDGRAAINTNGTPWLATAGSGDVLSGMVAGLLSQGMPAFEAACAAVWLHAEAAHGFGPGLVAEDLPGLLPPLLGDLLGAGPSRGGCG